jgi:hypothetical protein
LNLPAEQKSLPELYALWAKLSNVPIQTEGDLNETIEIEFMNFPVGTHREEIWHWFESQNPDFIVGEVMQGIRRD